MPARFGIFWLYLSSIRILLRGIRTVICWPSFILSESRDSLPILKVMAQPAGLLKRIILPFISSKILSGLTIIMLSSRDPSPPSLSASASLDVYKRQI